MLTTFNSTTLNDSTPAETATCPSVSQIAAAVRNELAVELSRVDGTISSRLATADYNSPDNAGIADIKAKTDMLKNSPTATDNADAVWQYERL